MLTNHYNSILIVGPTASGKTQLAAHLANVISTEIISVDSRQVYRQLTIGSGKDLNEYLVNNTHIPYHLINVADVNTEYHIHNYLQQYTQAFNNITINNKTPILCGGSMLYVNTLLTQAHYTGVPVNEELRERLKLMSLPNLQVMYAQHTPLAHADTGHHKRIIRAIEIQHYLLNNIYTPLALPQLTPLIIGLISDVTERRKKIKDRLNLRLHNGLIEEVQQLLQHHTTPERLVRLGLEYKFVTHYFQKKITKAELQEQLYNAICQYAKAQMTWLRKIEREGNKIHWLTTENDLKSKINYCTHQFLMR